MFEIGEIKKFIDNNGILKSVKFYTKHKDELIKRYWNYSVQYEKIAEILYCMCENY